MALAPVDMRSSSFDRLSGIAKEQVGDEARSGALFVFYGRRRDALKILFFDGSGMCIFYKRLDRGTFSLPTPVSGYVQADASAVYDALYRGEARTAPEEVPPKEVGCWAHARRRFFEAAVVAKDAAAREAIWRLHVLFELEEEWQGLAPAQRHARRQLRSRRLVDDFFAWGKAQYARVKDARGLVATAFGYAVRQEPGLRSFLDDGRLPMTNNHSKRALRFICGGRKAWLFFGSDEPGGGGGPQSLRHPLPERPTAETVTASSG